MLIIPLNGRKKRPLYTTNAVSEFLFPALKLSLSISFLILLPQHRKYADGTFDANSRFLCAEENEDANALIYYWISVGRTKCTLIIYISEVQINGIKEPLFTTIFAGKIPTNRKYTIHHTLIHPSIDEMNIIFDGMRCCCASVLFHFFFHSSLL